MTCNCGKPRNCGCEKIKGCIRPGKPECPPLAIIPIAIVEHPEEIGSSKDCFVHVLDTNTTYYVDDMHRIVVTWAGPVEKDGYDYESNPLKLRGQIVYDFENNRAIYYNKSGEYRIIELTDGGQDAL